MNYKKKNQRPSERRKSKEKGKKPRKRRGIILGRPVAKNIPLKSATVKASVELDKLSLFYKNEYQQLVDQNPSFEIMFEKNIPKSAMKGLNIDELSSHSKSLQTEGNAKVRNSNFFTQLWILKVSYLRLSAF